MKQGTKRGRGRPEHQPTAASRRRVAIAAGGGMTHEAIAQALKLDPKTLRKYYELELSSGASLKRAEVMEKLFASARKGSTSAARLYLQVQPEFTPVPLEDEKPSTEPKKGKKAQAQEDAGGAAEGTDWQDLLPANVTPLRPAG